MIEPDTIKLLRECDAGVQMGTSAIEEVLPNVRHEDFRNVLTSCKTEHEKLKTEILNLLGEYGDEGKAPNPMAKGMSWVKTNMKLAVEDSDGTVADLITDGCNMGVKSLHKYINQYQAADRSSRQLADKLVKAEERLANDMRPFL